MSVPANPFVISGYHGPNWFCDRLLETKRLISFVKNGNNVTLFALRRLGKTGLIHHVFHQLAAAKKQLAYMLIFFLPNRLKSLLTS